MAVDANWQIFAILITFLVWKRVINGKNLSYKKHIFFSSPLQW
jgi:hypothetical protein